MCRVTDSLESLHCSPKTLQKVQTLRVSNALAADDITLHYINLFQFIFLFFPSPYIFPLYVTFITPEFYFLSSTPFSYLSYCYLRKLSLAPLQLYLCYHRNKIIVCAYYVSCHHCVVFCSLSLYRWFNLDAVFVTRRLILVASLQTKTCLKLVIFVHFVISLVMVLLDLFVTPMLISLGGMYCPLTFTSTHLLLLWKRQICLQEKQKFMRT